MAEDKSINYTLHKDALQKALGQHLEDIQLTIEVGDRCAFLPDWLSLVGFI